MECAGNGRARLEPHVVSQPWLLEAVGTAEWTGVPVADLLEEAGRRRRRGRGPLHRARPRRRGRRRAGLPAQPPARRGRRRAAARLRDQRRAAAAAARLPAAAGRAGLVRDDEREVARADRRDRRAVRRLPAGDGLPDARARGRPRDAGHADHAARADGAAGDPGLHDARAGSSRPGRASCAGRAWSGWGAIEAVEVSADGGAHAGRRPALGPEPEPGAWRCVDVRVGRATPGEHELCCRARDAAGNAQPVDADWNVGGYANTSVQRVPVTVA